MTVGVWRYLGNVGEVISPRFKMSTNRIEYIDNLKGLAIFTVVLGHVVVFGYQNYENYIRIFASSFHLPLFMFLSGIVIKELPSPRKLIVKLFRFLCPFICVGLTYNFIISRSINYFFFDSMKSGFWYLWVLSEFYALLAILRAIHNYSRKTSNIFIDILFLISVEILLIIFEKYTPEASSLLSLNSCKSYWPFFFGGFIFRKYNLALILERYSNIICAFSAIIYLIVLYATITLNLHSYVNAITGLCAVPFLFILFKKRGHKNSLIDKELNRLGRYSLEIYMFEYFMLAFINLRNLEELFSSMNNHFLLLIIAIVITVLIVYSSIFIGYLSHETGYLDKLIYGKFFITKRK